MHGVVDFLLLAMTTVVLGDQWATAPPTGGLTARLPAAPWGLKEQLPRASSVVGRKQVFPVKPGEEKKRGEALLSCVCIPDSQIHSAACLWSPGPSPKEGNSTLDGTFQSGAPPSSTKQCPKEWVVHPNTTGRTSAMCFCFVFPSVSLHKITRIWKRQQ